MKKNLLSTMILSIASTGAFALDCPSAWTIEAGDKPDTWKASAPSQSFACSVKGGITGNLSNFKGQLFQSVFPVDRLEKYISGKLFNLIWGHVFVPKESIEEQIMDVVKDIQTEQENMYIAMEEDFAQLSTLTTTLISDVTNAIGFTVSEQAKVTNTNLNTILSFTNNTEFWNDLNGWEFPPIPPYILIPNQRLHNVGSVSKADVIVIDNNKSIEGSTVWRSNPAGTNPSIFKVENGDAVIEQGGITIFSFKRFYQQAEPFKAAPNITKVTFKDGRLTFSGENSFSYGLGVTADTFATASGGTISGTLSDARASGGTVSDASQYAALFTQAIIESDGTMYTYVPSKTTRAAKCTSGCDDIPWTNTQLDQFAQKVFTALKVYEESSTKSDNSPTTKNSIVTAINYVTNNIAMTDDTINITALGDQLNQALSTYSTNLRAELVNGEFKGSNGVYVLEDSAGKPVDLGQVGLTYYQLYVQATTILSNMAQAMQYAFYYDPEILLDEIGDWDALDDQGVQQLQQEFTTALKKLNETFAAGLVNYSVKAVITSSNGHDIDAGRFVNFNIIPGVKQQLMTFTNDDVAPFINIPFAVPKELSASDIDRYITLLRSGNLKALTSTDQVEPNFICAVAGSYDSNIACPDDDANTTLSQFMLLVSAFGILPVSPIDGDFGTGFANIVPTGKSNDDYTYAIQVRFNANMPVLAGSTNNDTLWQHLVLDNFLVDETLYDTYLSNMSPLTVNLPKGNWTQYCKIPENFGNNDDQTTGHIYKSIRSPLTLLCAENKDLSKKNYARHTIIPGSCVNVEDNYKFAMTDVSIDYNPQMHMLVCGNNSSDGSDFKALEKNFEVTEGNFYSKHSMLSCDGKWLVMTTKSNQNNPIIAADKYIPAYRSNRSQVMNTDIFRGNYCNQSYRSGAGNADSNSTRETLYANEAGYTWLTVDENWPARITNILPDGNWRDYCSQPVYYDNALITECGNTGHFFKINRNVEQGCSAYNLVVLDRTNPKGLKNYQLACWNTKTDQPEYSNLGRHLVKRGLVTPDIIDHCDLSIIGNEAEAQHVDFYCHAKNNASTWVKSTFPYDQNAAYTYHDNGSVTVAKWSGICPAYDYEVIDENGVETVFCAKMNQNSELEREMSPKAKQWQQNKYLGSSIAELCDLSALGQADWGNGQFFKTAPAFFCHGINDNGEKTPNKTWAETDVHNVEDNTWPKPALYTEFAVMNVGDVKVWHTPVMGTYQSQCHYIRSAGMVGQEYPEKIYATCGDTYNSGWNYESNCTAGSDVYANGQNKLTCMIEKGVPILDDDSGKCEISSYQNGKLVIDCEVTVEVDGEQEQDIQSTEYDDVKSKEDACKVGKYTVNKTGEVDCFISSILPLDDFSDIQSIDDACTDVKSAPYEYTTPLGVPLIGKQLTAVCHGEEHKLITSINGVVRCEESANPMYIYTKRQLTCNEFTPKAIDYDNTSIWDIVKKGETCDFKFDPKKRTFYLPGGHCSKGTWIDKELYVDACSANASFSLNFDDNKAESVIITCDNEIISQLMHDDRAMLNGNPYYFSDQSRTDVWGCYDINAYQQNNEIMISASCYASEEDESPTISIPSDQCASQGLKIGLNVNVLVSKLVCIE